MNLLRWPYTIVCGIAMVNPRRVVGTRVNGRVRDPPSQITPRTVVDYYVIVLLLSHSMMMNLVFAAGRALLAIAEQRYCTVGIPTGSGTNGNAESPYKPLFRTGEHGENAVGLPLQCLRKTSLGIPDQHLIDNPHRLLSCPNSQINSSSALPVSYS